jgi:hypothetical protein
MQFADKITSKFKTVKQVKIIKLEIRINENGKIWISEKDAAEKGMKISNLFEIN